MKATLLTALLGLDLQELTAIAETFGQAPFRARQIMDALYRQRVDSIAQISTLPQKFREELEQNFRWDCLRLSRRSSLWTAPFATSCALPTARRSRQSGCPKATTAKLETAPRNLPAWLEPRHHLRFQPGWLRGRLPVLPYRPTGDQAQSHRRRNRGSSLCGAEASSGLSTQR